MTELERLNLLRAECQQRLSYLAMMNMPSEPKERLQFDARYRLAQDALSRAETEYRLALGALSTVELIELTK